MHGSRWSVAPRSRNPRIDSIAARYIHPAAPVYQVHPPRGAGGVGGPRKHRPRLRDRIDAAFGVAGGAERRPVVEIGAPVPVAVPGLALQRGLERLHVLAPPRRAFVLAAHLGLASEFPEGRVQEPPEPDALPAPFATDAIHPVVPVPAADQGKPVDSDLEPAVES